jgi:hypothetical protein
MIDNFKQISHNTCCKVESPWTRGGKRDARGKYILRFATYADRSIAFAKHHRYGVTAYKSRLHIAELVDILRL